VFFSDLPKLRSVKIQVRDSEYGFSGIFSQLYFYISAAAPSNKPLTTVSISFSLSSLSSASGSKEIEDFLGVALQVQQHGVLFAAFKRTILERFSAGLFLFRLF
jgi:hypothetical protein